MDFRRLHTKNLNTKTVLLRVDFNVPRHTDGQISDMTRINTAIPTLQTLQEAGAKTVILSHYGRPEGLPDPALSLQFILPVLRRKLKANIHFCQQIDASFIKNVPQGDIILMENTRFDPREIKGDPDLSQAYAALGDIFVQDAFSSAHRNHCTSAGIAQFLPSFAGLAMAHELDMLSQTLETPQRPLCALVGGAKISTKLSLLDNLIHKLDGLIIGGGMANSFLAAKGYNVGVSLYEPRLIGTAQNILHNAQNANCEIILPVDVVVSQSLAAYTPHRICQPDQIGINEMIVDVGPQTLAHIKSSIDTAQTFIWNGPLGAFEFPPFDQATIEAAQYVASQVTQGKLKAIAGGGDTVAALNQAGITDQFTFISTAGGAFLEWLEGRDLPGITCLMLQE